MTPCPTSADEDQARALPSHAVLRWGEWLLVVDRAVVAVHAASKPHTALELPLRGNGWFQVKGDVFQERGDIVWSSGGVVRALAPCANIWTRPLPAHHTMHSAPALLLCALLAARLARDRALPGSERARTWTTTPSPATRQPFSVSTPRRP